jgi:hypothetical protein
MSSKKKQSDLKAALQNFGKAVARFRNDDDQVILCSRCGIRIVYPVMCKP